jgi:hypothetical protein
MRIDLSPVRSDDPLSLHRAGEVLSVNGLAFDLSPLPDDATLPQAAVGCPALASDIRREGGQIRLTLRLPHDQDAPAAALFPDPLDPAPQGPVDLPGHPGGQAATAPGAIDWGALVTAEAAETAARAAWRAAREVSKLQLVLGLAHAGLISHASAIAAAGGGIPAEFEAVVAAMPPEAQTEARIRWAGAATIPRLSPLILAVQAATGMPDETADALFGWGA